MHIPIHLYHKYHTHIYIICISNMYIIYSISYVFISFMSNIKTHTCKYTCMCMCMYVYIFIYYIYIHIYDSLVPNIDIRNTDVGSLKKKFILHTGHIYLFRI